MMGEKSDPKISFIQSPKGGDDLDACNRRRNLSGPHFLVLLLVG